MLRLPLELLLFIFELSDSSGLRNVRAANKALSEVATPVAFRTLHCTSTEPSTAGLLRLLKCSSIRPHVREIVYQDWYAESRGAAEPYVSMMSEYHAGENLVAAIEMLQELPALHALSFTFFPLYEDETEEFIHATDESDYSTYLVLQRCVLNALAAVEPAPALRSLTLTNLIALDNPVFAQPAFLALIQRLTLFHISTLSDVQRGAHDRHLTRFYANALPPMLRAPGSSLTSLTLHADQDTGKEPGLNLRGLSYPHLAHLSLQRVIFSAATGAEAFVLAHAQTLMSLSLLRCKISHDEVVQATPRMWSDVYGTLSAQLVGLRRLQVVEEWEGEGLTNWTPGGKKVRYVWLETPGGWWNPYFPGHVKQDKRALESFRQIVDLRRAL
ncbi:hypothetical protein BV25DRAFT_1918864 [Artomyces pyxidatus]|uniref:Uncharacterized protein n=1 Tax=Artomyces pyxidatus TaxID=48021 RepID=A0ACB8SRW4_9AGAM|nr:hypothetical protein BV25DRAFT_1918864 [Artomyces pyxidatus]